ncbi:MAG: protein jag [Endomicrobia bacterium]|jgi:spoIIIJ-associated protein|nr:protein jag [Endomicrobiia bacterium]
MPEIEITGKTAEEAIKKGLEKLGCAKEQAQIKVLDEGTAGLFGLMGAKPARVLIIADNTYCKPEAVDVNPKEACEKTEKILSEIISKMGLGLKKIKSEFNIDSVNAEIEAEDSGFIIGKNGQTLDALEYIAQIIANNDLNSKIKVNLDCENYRKKQNERLKVLADKAVEYVNRTEKIYRFEPMSPKERKIIHTYLKNNPKIETFSEGEGAMRKVGIKLSKKTA